MSWKFFDSTGAVRTTDPFGRGVVYSPTAPTRTDVIWVDTSVSGNDYDRYIASMYLANSGSPTHTNTGGWQKVGGGGGTSTWVSLADVRPSGVTAQVNTATKRIEIQRAGLYRVGYGVTFTSIAVNTLLGVAAYVNGVERSAHLITLNNATPSWNGSKILSLGAGEYVELYAYQADTASEAYFTVAPSHNFIEVEYLGENV